jgi:hypothetical protein
MFNSSYTQIRRTAIAVIAAMSLPFAMSAAAVARPADTNLPPTVAHQFKVGDTPGEFGKSYVPQTKAGDTPADFPSVQSAPVQVGAPSRTIADDDVPVLPIILVALALLVALAGGAQIVAQRRGTVRTH